MEHIYVLTSSQNQVNRLSPIIKNAELVSKKNVEANSLPERDQSIILIYLDKGDSNPSCALISIKLKWPEIFVIYIGHRLTPELLIELYRAGLSDYLTQPVSQKDIDDAITRIRLQVKQSKFNPERYRLKKREVQVCNLLARGLLSREIADHLHLTPATVKVYKSRLFTKLNVKTIPELMRKVLCY